MAFLLERPPADPDELYWYVRLRFGVAVPRTVVCADHCSPFQAFSDAYFAVNTVEEGGPATIALWHGSRGLSGKSYTLSLLAVTIGELLGSDVNLLGGSLSQSMNIHEHVGNAMRHENAPEYMVIKSSSTQIRLTNGAKIVPLTASQKTVRGPHPPRLLLDEIDEMDIKILRAALGQPLPQENYLHQEIPPYTVMCSTWQNAQGTFTEMLQEAEEKGWPIYRWCYRESANEIDGWLSQATIEAKKNDISKAMWEVEYELNEPSGGVAAFDRDAIEAMFDLRDDQDELVQPLAQKIEKDFEELLFQKPTRHGEYVVAADWGKRMDYTVIVVIRIDRFPRQLCYYLKVNRRPWPVMMGYFSKAISRYKAEAIHDATGLGDVIDDMVDERAVGFQMRGAERDDMLTEYVVAVEKGWYKVPMVKSAYQAHRWCQVDDLYKSGKEFHLPDEVCAFALAEHLAQNIAPLAAPAEVVKDKAPTEVSMVGSDEELTEHGGHAAPGRMAEVYRKGWQDDRELSLTV